MHIPSKLTKVLENKIIRFIISGGTAASIEYATFAVLHFVGLHILLANSTSFICGLFVSFSLNKLWVFKISGNAKLQFGSYFILAVVNLCISNSLLWLSVNKFMVAPLIAKLVIMATIAIWNYLVFSKLIFVTKPS